MRVQEALTRRGLDEVRISLEPTAALRSDLRVNTICNQDASALELITRPCQAPSFQKDLSILVLCRCRQHQAYPLGNRRVLQFCNLCVGPE